MLKSQPPLNSITLLFRRLTIKCLAQGRYLSINSAIHKGIRKSTSREGAGGLLHDGGRSRGPTLAKHPGKVSRLPRPNHQTNQDPEDFAESRKVNEAKMTVKQPLYREADRGRLSRNRKSPWEPSLFEPKTRPGRSAPMGKTLGSAKPSGDAMPNRAARRAAMFGHSRVESSTNKDLTGHRIHLESTTGLSKVPLSTPYTTPASEFLYGASAVSAALRFSGRKFYKFYSYDGPDRVDQRQDESMRGLARSKGVEVMRVRGEWLRLLDTMSRGRPHNVSLNEPFLSMLCAEVY